MENVLNLVGIILQYQWVFISNIGSDYLLIINGQKKVIYRVFSIRLWYIT